MSNYEYILNAATMNTAAYTSNTNFPSTCYTLTATKAGTLVPKPWLAHNITDRTFSISSSSTTDIGVYKIDFSAESFDQATCSAQTSSISCQVTIKTSPACYDNTQGINVPFNWATIQSTSTNYAPEMVIPYGVVTIFDILNSLL